MKIIKKYRNPDGGIFPDWWYEAKANLATDNSDNDQSFNFLEDQPIDYQDIAYTPIPESKPSKPQPSKTPIKDRISKLWDKLVSLSGQTMLANPGGYPMYTGAQKFNTTIGDELKVAGAGAATIGLPAALNYAYNYPVTAFTDLVYGYGGTKLGGKVGNLVGQPIDYLTGNHYASEGLGYLGNLVGGGFGLNAANNFRKRAIETAMRSGGYAKPDFSAMWATFKQMPSKRKFDIANYVFTGRRTGPKGYYNSFAPKNFEGDQYLAYHGLTNGDMIEGNDLIDAYLYGKPLDPSLAVRLSPDSPNPFVDYIARHYPGKDIPMYQLKSDFGMGFKEAEAVTNPSNWEGAIEHSGTNPFTFYRKGLDVGGHIEQQGVTEGGQTAIRGADIWKFNPKDYIKKWLENLNNKGKKVPYYLRFGLNEVDKAGTPVITTTPWVREFNDQEWSNYWDQFVPEAP